jgi:hypothetical protein
MTSHRYRWALWAWVPALVALLLFEPLFLDRSLLSFDNRLWPPFCFHPLEAGSAAMNFLTSDINGWIMPETLLQVERLRAGEVPLWNPHGLLGQPLLANLGFAPFYPTSLLYLWLDPIRAYAVSMAVHLIFLGLGMQLFLRKRGLHPLAGLLGAVVATIGGFLAVHLHLPHFIRTAAWLPWMLWSADALLQGRSLRVTARFALAVGGSLLAGFPQLALLQIYLVLGLLVASVIRRRQWRTLVPVILATGLGGAISAIHLLPATELLQNSLRPGRLSVEQLQEKSLEPECLLGLVFPHFFGDAVQQIDAAHPQVQDDQAFPSYRRWLDAEVQNNFVENTLYVGLLPLLACLWLLFTRGSWSSFAIALAGAAGLAVALGVPGVLDFATLLPGLGAGSPKRALWLASFALAWLTAVATHSWLLRPAPAKPSLVAAAFCLLVAAVFLLPYETWLFPSASESDQSWFRQTLGFDGLRFAAAGLGLTTLTVLRRKSVLCGVLIVVLISADLGLLLRRNNPPQPLHDPYPRTPGIEWLQHHSGEGRLVTFANDLLLPATFGQVFGLDSVGGVAALMIREVGELLHSLDPQTVSLDDPRVVRALRDAGALQSPLLQVLSVGSILASQRFDGFDPVYASEPELLAVYQPAATLSRAYSVKELRVLADRDLRLKALAAADFQPGSQAIVEQLPEGLPPGPLGDVSCQWQRLSPEWIRLELSGGGERAFIVVSEAYFPGWEAEVDGVAVPLHRANHALMGLAIPAGAQRVDLRYQPASFRIGGFLSLVGVLLAFGALIFGQRTKPKDREALPQAAACE